MRKYNHVRDNCSLFRIIHLVPKWGLRVGNPKHTKCLRIFLVKQQWSDLKKKNQISQRYVNGFLTFPWDASQWVWKMTTVRAKFTVSGSVVRSLAGSPEALRRAGRLLKVSWGLSQHTCSCGCSPKKAYQQAPCSLLSCSSSSSNRGCSHRAAANPCWGYTHCACNQLPFKLAHRTSSVEINR